MEIIEREPSQIQLPKPTNSVEVARFVTESHSTICVLVDRTEE
ncbi:unnamed protein product [Acanthoscelides obtectus]|uniref:Uncharacterized protein n=1 Tax=Acanthoscelides obtectus TaxID=200917 RepID=A0A9P0LMU5_ACAOB|nr:unnamed protein product [Acanthoscelides obtectus]CAK1652121.1 hypothetical protein AOBTE_LOCUS17697 [Acanthoscelides obtectus]